MSVRRLSAAPISSAASTLQRRGLSGWKMRPIAQAPRSTASRASSSVVRPQILVPVMRSMAADASAAAAWRPRAARYRGLGKREGQVAPAAASAGRLRAAGGSADAGWTLVELDVRRLHLVAAVVL